MATSYGAVAQLGERLLCKQEAVGSIPSSSTTQESEVKGSGISNTCRLRASAQRCVFSRTKNSSLRAALFFNNLEGKAHLGLMRVWMR